MNDEHGRTRRAGLAPFLEIFQQAASRLRCAPWFGEEWICKCDLWPSAAQPRGVVLKLLKRHWSDDRPDKIGNTSGIFFSLWTDGTKLTELRYNIHALKLRQLKGYTLQSRKFAADFREAFLQREGEWPQLRVDYGPQTLMEGAVLLTLEKGEDLLMDLSSRFPPVAEIIDGLLRQAEKAGN